MKNYFFLTTLIVLIISCDTVPTSSQPDDPEAPVKIANLTGAWNWVETTDTTGQVVSESTIDDTRSIVITQDFTFTEYHNDTKHFSDKFNLYKAVVPNTTDTLMLIDWRSSRRFNLFIYSLKSNSLVIIHLPYRYKSKYSRIN